MSTEQQAKLLEEIAAVMRERPEDWWLEFEVRSKLDGWHDTNRGQVEWFVFNRPLALRRRPRTITIAGIEVPEPMREAPPVGARYWVVDPTYKKPFRINHWDGGAFELRQLKRGFCHYTEGAAQQHARALILASGGEVE